MARAFPARSRGQGRRKDLISRQTPTTYDVVGFSPMNMIINSSLRVVGLHGPLRLKGSTADEARLWKREHDEEQEE